MSGKKQLVNIHTPTDISMSENSILEYYIAEEISDNIEDFVDKIKSGLKSLKGVEGFIDKDGKTSFTVKSAHGLELQVATSAGKKKFNESKAVQIILERLEKSVVDKKFATYSIQPKTKEPIPKEAEELLNKYFKVDKNYSIDEKDLWSLGLLQEDIDACYDRGDDVLKVTRKSKIPGKMLLKMYEDSRMDFLKTFLIEE